MHPMLISALVAPRQDDLRKSARAAMAGSRLHSRGGAAVPLPMWARALGTTESGRLAAEPVACGAAEDVA